MKQSQLVQSFFILCFSLGCVEGQPLTVETVTMDDIAPLARQLFDDISNFWLKYGPDPTYGGFYGTLDSWGQSVQPNDKTIVQQARHLYATSFLYYYHKLGVVQLSVNATRLENQMERLYNFVVKNFVDYTGGEFFYKVNQDGSQVLDADKRLYYTSFGIFGLSWYAMATNNAIRRENAKRIALNAFYAVDGRLNDLNNLGYDQSRENNWFGHSASSYGYSQQGAAKGFNSHMHYLEALIALYQVQQDSTVYDRLIEVVKLFVDEAFGSNAYGALVMTADGSSLSGDVVEFGHDLEAVHLLIEARNLLGSNFPYDWNTVFFKLVQVTDHSISFAFDKTYGGFYTSGRAYQLASGSIKTWWVQMESALGVYRTYQLNQNQFYLQVIYKTLLFSQEKFQSQTGEFYWYVDNYGSPAGKTNLGDIFKASYHNLRCLTIIAFQL